MADLGELILRLKVDDDEYIKGLNNARKRAESFGDINVNVSAGKSFDTLTARIRSLQKERAKLTLEVDGEKQLERLNKEIAQLQNRRIKLDADASLANARIAKLDADIQQLQNRRIKLQTDGAPLAEIQKIDTQLKLLEARRIKLSLNEKEILGNVQTIDARIKSLDDAKINVDINAKKATERIKQIDAELDAAGRRGGQRFGDGFSSVSQGIFQGIGQQITNTLVNAVQSVGALTGRAITGFFGGAIKEFTSLDGALGQFEAKAGLTGDALEAVKDEIIALAEPTAFTATEVANLATQLVALGVPADEVVDKLGGITKLSDVLGEDPVLTGRVVQGGLAAYEQLGLTSDELADKLAKLITTSAVGGRGGLAELEQLFSKAAPVAAKLGISIDDLNASFATIRKTGATAEVSATAVTNVLTKLATEADKLKANGVEIAYDENGAVDLFQTLTNIRDRISGLSDADQIAFLADIFKGGARGAGALVGLLDNLDTEFQTVKAASEDAAGSLEDVSAVINQTVPRQQNLLSGLISSFLANFGGAFENTILGTLQFLNQVVTDLSKQELGLGGLVTSGQQFNAVITNSPDLVSSIADGLANVFRFFNGIIQKAIELTTSFLLNREAVATVGTQITNLGERFKAIFDFVGSIVNLFVQVGGEILRATGLVGDLQDRFEGNTNTLQLITEFINSVTVSIVEAIQGAQELSSNFENLSGGVVSIGNALKLAFLPLNVAISTFGRIFGILENIKGQFAALQVLAGGTGKNLEEGLTNTADALGVAGDRIASLSNQEGQGGAGGVVDEGGDTGRVEEEEAAADAKEQREEQARAKELQFEDEKLARERAFDDAKEARSLALEDKIESKKLATENKIATIEEGIRAKEEAHNLRQEQIKDQAAANRRAEEEAFNKEQQAAEKAFNEQINTEEAAALQEFDRQQQLDAAATPADRKKLEEEFAAEDERAAKRAAIEAEFNAKREAFEAEQQAKQAAFEEEQRQKEIATQQLLEANERAFLTEKEAAELQIENLKKQSEAEILQLKRDSEAQEREIKRAFEDEQRRLDRENAAAIEAIKKGTAEQERQAEVDNANEIAAVQEEQRRLDAESRLAAIDAEREKNRLAAERRVEERKLLADIQAVAREGSTIGSGVAGAVGAGLEAFRTGGTFQAGQLGLAGEAGPELVKFRGGGEGLFTGPTLFKFPEPGRIYSSPTTSRKLSERAGKDSMAAELTEVKRLLKDVLAKPSGQINTEVNLQGMHPEQVRRELTRMEIQKFKALARL